MKPSRPKVTRGLGQWPKKMSTWDTPTLLQTGSSVLNQLLRSAAGGLGTWVNVF